VKIDDGPEGLVLSQGFLFLPALYCG